MNYNGIPIELARTEAVQAAQPERHSPLRSVAQRLSRRGLAAAKVELVNHALLAVTELCFELDSDGTMANVDTDGRLLVPAPWGRAGYATWGLRITEGRALNWLMRRRGEAQNEPLFVYDAGTRQWCINLAYSTRTALAYLKGCPVTLAEWRDAWRAVRSEWSRTNIGGE